MRACDAFQRNVLEEQFVVGYHGRAGDYEVTRGMPVNVRHWWFERVKLEHEEDAKRNNGGKTHDVGSHVPGATFGAPPGK